MFPENLVNYGLSVKAGEVNVRKAYEQELVHLKNDILSMGIEVKEAVEKSLNLMNTKSINRSAYEIIENDEKINKIELRILDTTTSMIARQQPVATDLRRCIVALKIASDLERVGDLAVDIAKSAVELKTDQYKLQIDELNSMAAIAIYMLEHSLEAYDRERLISAQKIASLDDQVDEKYNAFIRRSFRNIPEQVPSEVITQLSFIGRYIERVADHATNIAEWVVYEVNGHHFDLN